MVKETVSRSVVAKRMGSNPIPRKEFLCSLKTGWWQVRIFRTSAPALLRRVVGGAAAAPNRISSVGRARAF